MIIRFSKPLLRLATCCTCLALAACTPAPEAAKKELLERKVKFTVENFLKAIEQQDKTITDLFLKAEMSVNSQTPEGKTPLMLAAQLKDTSMLHALLGFKSKSPVNPNLKDLQGKTALHYAIEAGNMQHADMLLQLNPDLSAADKQGNTVFHYLVTFAQASDAASFLRNLSLNQTSSGIDQKNMDGNTPLLAAILAEKNDLALGLIEAGANINLTDRAGMTPLMQAVTLGDTPVIQKLLQNAADLTATDTMGRNVLMHSIKIRQPELTADLLKRLSKTSMLEDQTLLLLQEVLRYPPVDEGVFSTILRQGKKLSPQQYSSLMLQAFDAGAGSVAPALIDAGADPETTDASGNTPLLLALQAGNSTVASTLLQAGAKTTVSNNIGLTPAEIAVEKGMTEIVREVVREVQTASYRGRSGYTPAEIAVMRGYPGILEHLLSLGAPLNLDVALLWSIQEGDGKAVPVLLAHGANPRVLTQDKIPALWLAAFQNQPEAVQAFLKAGTPVDIPNPQNMGTTPLMIAAQLGYCDVVRILLENGASKSVRDKADRTAPMHAEEAPTHCFAQ